MPLPKAAKRLLLPVQGAMRRFLALPTIAEQKYLGSHGAIYSAAAFCARNMIAGDYLEFGVWKGDSFIHAYDAIQKARRDHRKWLAQRQSDESVYGNPSASSALWRDWPPRFFAFDSFEGLPESLPEETSEDWCSGAYTCSEAQFRQNVIGSGVDPTLLVTVPGFYEDSLTSEQKQRQNIRQAAIVHIDCDYYESTILALNFVADLLTQGSVIIFDDWFRCQGSPHRGEQRACREWLERNPQIELIEFWREPPQPVSFIVNFEKRPSEVGSSRVVEPAAARSFTDGDRPYAPLSC